MSATTTAQLVAIALRARWGEYEANARADRILDAYAEMEAKWKGETRGVSGAVKGGVRVNASVNTNPESVARNVTDDKTLTLLRENKKLSLSEELSSATATEIRDKQSEVDKLSMDLKARNAELSTLHETLQSKVGEMQILEARDAELSKINETLRLEIKQLNSVVTNKADEIRAEVMRQLSERENVTVTLSQDIKDEIKNFHGQFENFLETIRVKYEDIDAVQLDGLKIMPRQMIWKAMEIRETNEPVTLTDVDTLKDACQLISDVSELKFEEYKLAHHKSPHNEKTKQVQSQLQQNENIQNSLNELINQQTVKNILAYKSKLDDLRDELNSVKSESL